MRARLHLGLVFHMHQPVGNYDWVFAQLHQQSYEPLLACLERHPAIRVGLHYSGPLLDWLAANQPDYLVRVGALVARGQVELLGGGYYEPILPAISEADRLGQLRLMSERIAQRFGARPDGAWLSERVWTPDLPLSLAAAGIRWTVVDDTHFEAAGFDPEALPGPYMTEHEGSVVHVYGSSTRLRYLIPWKPIDDCIDYLEERADRHPGGVVVMGDDGEKFGGWPTTFALCWDNRWMDTFFERLEAESGWLQTVHLGAWLRNNRPAGLCYLPSASYMEMGEWALPPQDQAALHEAKELLEAHGREDLARFVRGSHWPNFLVRYPESNLMHKRILHLSRDAHAAGNAEALDRLWQAQCNCPFWHGVFGGIYLEHIRDANTSNFAAADAMLHPGRQPADKRDWDFDGAPSAICLRSGGQTVVIDLEQAEILHWELPAHGWHLTHVVASRPEAYHGNLAVPDEDRTYNIHDPVRVKDPRVLDQPLVYDARLRVAAQDVSGATDEASWRSRRNHAPAYDVVAVNDLAATWTGTSSEGAFSKELRLSERGLAVEVCGSQPIASEWNLSLPYFPGGSPPKIMIEGDRVHIATPRFELECRHNAAGAWVEPVHSISNTEGGVELAPQGWCLVFVPQKPVGGEQWRLLLEWSAS